MANSPVKSKRYGGFAPSAGKNPFATADSRGSAVSAIRKARGGSTKKRPARPAR